MKTINSSKDFPKKDFVDNKIFLTDNNGKSHITSLFNVYRREEFYANRIPVIMLEKNFDGVIAYTQSKLALMMFTIDQAEELKDDNVTVNALHPGTYLDTNMVHNAGINPQGTAQSGADAEVYLVTSPGLRNVTGKYFNVMKESKAHPQAYDANAREHLHEIALKLTA